MGGRLVPEVSAEEVLGPPTSSVPPPTKSPVWSRLGFWLILAVFVIAVLGGWFVLAP